MPYHEKDVVAVPIIKKREIAVSAVSHDYGMRRDMDVERSPVVTAFAVRNIHELRQKAVIVKQRVHLDRTFPCRIVGPFKK